MLSERFNSHLHCQKKKGLTLFRKWQEWRFLFHPILPKKVAGAVKKDYLQFIEISLSSCFELESQLLIAQIVSFGDVQKQNQLLQELDEEEKI